MVFNNEQDLKQHRMREHNEQLSRNERRAAMHIPVNLNVSYAPLPSGTRFHCSHMSCSRALFALRVAPLYSAPFRHCSWRRPGGILADEPLHLL